VRRIFPVFVVASVLSFEAGAAFAGGSGGVGNTSISVSSLPINLLLGFCNYFGMSVCPPTTPALQVSPNSLQLSPNIAELAALSNGNPDGVRATFSLFTGAALYPPNAAVSAVNSALLEQSTRGSINLTPPVLSDLPSLTPAVPPNLPNLTLSVSIPRPSPTFLSQLTPIAFITDFTPLQGLVPGPEAGATLLNDPAANSFFHAVTAGLDGQPQTLDLFFDYLPQTQTTFAKGQILGDITLPLVILNTDGSESPVLTKLQIQAACAGGSACLTATFVRPGVLHVGEVLPGGFPGHSAAEVGLTFLYDFGPSPNSPIPHAIFELRVPLLVTAANDPAYFGKRAAVPVATGVNQISGFPTAFNSDVRGFSPAFLGLPVGASPGAAEVIADFTNNGDGIGHHAVDAFLAIGTDGATVVHILRQCAPSPGADSCGP
jgi:hypothetical protein